MLRSLPVLEWSSLPEPSTPKHVCLGLSVRTEYLAYSMRPLQKVYSSIN